MASTKPNIILIVIDALRARNLSCYGYKKQTSPNIDSVATKGVLFQNAYCTIPVTDPSLTTISTGMLPRSHGIVAHGERVTSEASIKLERRNIRQLAEILRDEGYRTCAIDWIDRWHKRGFQEYKTARRMSWPLQIKLSSYLNRLPYWAQRIVRRLWKLSRLSGGGIKSENPSATIYTNMAVDFIKSNSDQKFFLFLHYWDTHTPYPAPDKYSKQFYDERESKSISEVLSTIGNPKARQIWEEFLKGAKGSGEIVGKYDGAIAFIDHELGRLFETLKDRDLWDNTFIILTSDHGESLTEHEIYFDHHGLYDETIHVPLLFHFPSKLPQGKRIPALVQHVDLLPTILDMLGEKWDEDAIDGESLVPLIYGKAQDMRPFVFAEEAAYEKKQAIRTKRYKYIAANSQEEAFCQHCGRTHGGIKELYDLNEDPAETRNIAQDRREVVAEMKELLSQFTESLEKKASKRETVRVKESIRKLKGKGI